MNIVPLKQVGRWAAIALIGLTVLSCKKDHPKPEPEPEPTDRTEGQLIKDDIYKYYKLYSLWADESIFPDYSLKPWEFTDKYSSPNFVLFALRDMTPPHIGAGYSGVLDRFSKIEAGEYSPDMEANDGTRMDKYDGYGISVQWFSIDDGLTAQPFISFVEGGSPAQEIGFQRADRITAVNEDNEDYSVGVTCKGKNCDVVPQDVAKFNRLYSTIDAALASTGSLTLQVKRVDKLFAKTIKYGYSYVINPIYKDIVYSNSNIGYLALSSFEKIQDAANDSGNSNNKAITDAVFDKFQDKQIKNLIVDLRYNGGGYVDAAVYIADKIAGAKRKGQLMLTYEMNKYMQSDAAAGLRDQLELKDTYFTGSSTLDLNKVYFLVSEETASAAEMLINVLVPHMNVEIIATGTRTFGKPVGFWGQSISYNGREKLSFWPASFILKNSRGNLGEKYNKGTERGLRDYWDGLIPDKQDLGDDVSEPVGSPNDPMVAAALSDAAPASKASALSRRLSKPSIFTLNKGKIHTRPERGMIKTRSK